MQIPQKTELANMYVNEQKSAHEIATILKCSDNKINYWLKKYGIKKRSISDATYISSNPSGDPFIYKPPVTKEDFTLFGMGVGLYWGEGNKKNKNTVRLGNTDPNLVKKFLEFIDRFYAVSPERIRFGLQIFSDMNPEVALRFWTKSLSVSSKKFGKIIVTPARGVGSYREKTKHGVLTVYIFNKKLRDLICGEIEKFQIIP